MPLLFAIYRRFPPVSLPQQRFPLPAKTQASISRCPTAGPPNRERLNVPPAPLGASLYGMFSQVGVELVSYPRVPHRYREPASQRAPSPPLCMSDELLLAAAAAATEAHGGLGPWSLHNAAGGGATEPGLWLTRTGSVREAFLPPFPCATRR